MQFICFIFPSVALFLSMPFLSVLAVVLAVFRAADRVILAAVCAGEP